MAKLKISDEWWSAPAESESGELIIVTGRRDMDNVIAYGKYKYRVEVSWHYGEGGMPDVPTSELMEMSTALSQLTRSPSVQPTTPPTHSTMLLEDLATFSVILPLTLTSLMTEPAPALPKRPRY